jgi:hypothetical protein
MLPTHPEPAEPASSAYPPRSGEEAIRAAVHNQVPISALDLAETPLVARDQPLQIDVSHGEIEAVALMFKQGGRDTFVLVQPWNDILRTVRVPQPGDSNTHNRELNEKHALDYGEYVVNMARQITPSLYERTSTLPPYRTLFEAGAVKVVLLRLTLDQLKAILDGQHRTRGAWAKREAALRVDQDELERMIVDCQRRGEPYGELQERLDETRHALSVLSTELIPVTLMVCSDSVEYEQAWNDINDKALGVPKSVSIRFDSTDVVNRAVKRVVQEFPLLAKLADVNKDTVTGNNRHWLSVKHVSDITKTLQAGIYGRVTVKRKAQLDEDALAEYAINFFDTLVAAFPDPFDSLLKNKLTTPELRRSSLWGSAVWVRVIAAVYRELLGDGWDRGLFIAWLRTLDMSAPIKAGSMWLATRPSEKDGDPPVRIFGRALEINASAPYARRQDVDDLYESIVENARAWGLVNRPTPSGSVSQAAA